MLSSSAMMARMSGRLLASKDWQLQMRLDTLAGHSLGTLQVAILARKRTWLGWRGWVGSERPESTFR